MARICSIKECSNPSVWTRHTAGWPSDINLCENHYQFLNHEIRLIEPIEKRLQESLRATKSFLDDPESVAPATKSKMKKALQDAGVISVKIDTDQLWGRPKERIEVIDRNFYDKISRIVQSLESS